jgi:tRNA pseudouridine32 synthase/23S rRNA pseudouridine746 synthase
VAFRFHRFDLPPAPRDLPEAFPSPFDAIGPHALARRAAVALQAELRSGSIAPGFPTALLDGPDGGKMFGVLVVQESSGRIGYLKAFSGMLDGRWGAEGFVPPLFDQEARAALEPAGEIVVKALSARRRAMETSPTLLDARRELANLRARHATTLAALREQHESNRRSRHERRAAIRGSSAPCGPDALHALDQESRRDKAERRRLEASQEEERLGREAHAARLERRLEALDRLCRITSRRLMQRLQDTYVIRNARGDHRPLRSLFAPGEPPSGAADCAAPKLLACAFAHSLRPIALAEFWWGAPPATGGRIAGEYYPACREKCGPLLPFMLDGMAVAAPRSFSPPDVSATALRIVFEDEWLVVVDKPVGLLSVPGRDAAGTDSVLARLRARYPQATGPLVVHRLDMDTSGLLVAGLDPATFAALQRQFARREVEKRYVAWVEGRVTGDGGTIDFPLRVDVDDRPRQIFDAVHGKAALTDWKLLERTAERSRVALFPRTGRTHQLRVHAAHPRGLGAPIVGDRLYGHAAERLLLHAERLELTHPSSGRRMSFESPAPF